MKEFFKSTFNKTNRKVTFIFLAISVIAFVIASITGTADYPPGLALCLIGSAALILAFTHHLRKVKNFLILMAASFIGFIVFAILHNFAEMSGLGPIFEVIGVIFFLIAIFICPAGIAVGGIGSIVMFIKNKNKVQ